MPTFLKYLLSLLMESLIQVMDSELQFQMAGIHVLQQLAAPGKPMRLFSSFPAAYENA